MRVSLLQWVRRLIKRPESNTALFLKHLLRTNNLPDFFAHKLQHIPEGVRSNPVYSEMFILWNQYHAVQPADENEVRRELIWENRFITSGVSTLLWKSWEAKGISRINDICQQGEDRLCSHTEIRSKFDVRCFFLDALQLRLSIPWSWRQMLTSEWREPPLPCSLSGIDILLPGEQPMDILAANSKAMYKAFILQPNTRSTAFQRWSELDGAPLQITDIDDWNEANLSVYRATRETKLQSLHFKILNRVLPCNRYLKLIRIKSSDDCDLCGQVDSIIHFLFECHTVQTFWLAICRWFDRVEHLALDTLSPKQFLFGLPRSAGKAQTINFIVMTTKFFIFRQRLFHGGSLDITHWLREFKMKLLVERDVLYCEGKSNQFAKWRRILNALG